MDTTTAELIEECRRREADGLQVPIVIRRKNPPTGRRVRVLPGVMGEIACVHDDGRIVAYVDAKRLRLALEAPCAT